MKKPIIWAGIVLVVLAGLFAVSQYYRIHRPANINLIVLAGQNIAVDVALTPEAHAQGLSGRDGLAPDEGMLFVFEKPGRLAFWMKDMKFPIDIIWLDASRKIVYIEKNALPESFPEQFAPEMDAKYVLEVVAGFSDKYNIKTGDEVVFTYQ